MLCSLSSRLKDEDVRDIAALEKQLGHPLLAFSCHAIDPAALNADEVKKIQELEGKLGVSLVAVDA